MRRVALVTGASRGLGATLAGFLAAQGYAIVAGARGREALEGAAAPWRARAAVVHLVDGDVSRPEVRRRLVDACRTEGRLDLLVNNASELGPSPLVALEHLELDAWRRILEVNLLGPVALAVEALPLLEVAHGLVVNISSDAAIGAYERWGGYGASKAALDLASRTMAAELRSRGVSVVAVDPGDLRTSMHQAAYAGEDISDRPLPEVTVPFWAWLLGRPPATISGGRYRAQATTWEAADAA